MNIKKLCLALSITAIFGLVACGDDSSSSPSKDKDSSSIEGDDEDDVTESKTAVEDFSGCDFSIDDDEWSYSYESLYKSKYNPGDVKVTIKMKVGKDSLYYEKRAVNVLVSKEKCIKDYTTYECAIFDDDWEIGDDVKIDEECEADFKKDPRSLLLGDDNYIECAKDGETTVTKVRYSIDSKEKQFKEFKSACQSVDDVASGKSSSKKDDSKKDDGDKKDSDSKDSDSDSESLVEADTSVDFTTVNSCEFTMDDEIWEFNYIDPYDGEVEHYKYVLSKDGKTRTEYQSQVDTEIDASYCEEYLKNIKSREDEAYACVAEGLFETSMYKHEMGVSKDQDNYIYNGAIRLCRQVKKVKDLPKCNDKHSGESWNVVTVDGHDVDIEYYVCEDGKWVTADIYSDIYSGVEKIDDEDVKKDDEKSDDGEKSDSKKDDDKKTDDDEKTDDQKTDDGEKSGDDSGSEEPVTPAVDKKVTVDTSIDFNAKNDCDFEIDDSVWEFNVLSDRGEPTHRKYTVNKSKTKLSLVETSFVTGPTYTKAECDAELAVFDFFENEDAACLDDGMLFATIDELSWSADGDEERFLVAKARCRTATKESNFPSCTNKREGEEWELAKIEGDADDPYVDYVGYICSKGKWMTKEDYENSESEDEGSDDEGSSEGESDGDSFSESESAPEMEFVDGED